MFNCCWLAVCIVVVVLCVLLSFYVYLLCCVCIAVFTLDAGLLVRSQYSEGPATGHLNNDFSWFPCVYKQMLRWFPTFQFATTCFSCSPPDLNLVVTDCSCLVFIFVVVLYVLLSSYVYLLYYLCIAVFTLDAGLLARSQNSEDPATGHLDTGFSWFPCVYKQMLRWFPTFQVATTCFSCSPPDLNLVVTDCSCLVCIVVVVLCVLL